MAFGKPQAPRVPRLEIEVAGGKYRAECTIPVFEAEYTAALAEHRMMHIGTVVVSPYAVQGVSPEYIM